MEWLKIAVSCVMSYSLWGQRSLVILLKVSHPQSLKIYSVNQGKRLPWVTKGGGSCLVFGVGFTGSRPGKAFPSYGV